MKELKSHPLADEFPEISAEEQLRLVEDIKSVGLRDPITLLSGKILDGRHRYRACLAAGVEPVFVEFDGGFIDAEKFVLSKNLMRRHLTGSQRAMLISKYITTKHGGDRKSEQSNQVANLLLDRQQAAQMADVSPRMIQSSVKVRSESPELTKQVIDGKQSIHAAEEKLDAKENPPALPPAKVEPQPEPPATIIDAIGRTVPNSLVADWELISELGNHLRALISEIKTTVERELANDNPFFCEINNVVVSEANALRYTLQLMIPYAVCPACQGRTRSTCTFCKRRGCISKHMWNSPAVSPELKAVISKTVKSK